MISLFLIQLRSYSPIVPTRLHRYDFPGLMHFWTFSTYRRLTFFWHDAIKQIAVDGLRHLQSKFSICLVGYVIMPEHLHVLLYPHARGEPTPQPISKLLHAFKRKVGQEGKKALKQFAREDRPWAEPIRQWMQADEPFFQTRGYDFNVETHDKLIEKLNYCHKNPLTRRPVTDAADWHWNSYRYYGFDDETVLRMDWDWAWPIRW